MSPSVPHHIAIIMDGNGRWAEERGLPRAEGHRKGAQTIESIVEACRDRGVKYLTLYAFSEENWNRPSDEVRGLMQLLKLFLEGKRASMIRKGVRFRTIGDIERLDSELHRSLLDTEQATREGTSLTLVVALSYGSRQEILRAMQRIICERESAFPGSVPPAGDITLKDIERELFTHDIPDPDLLIRTSGEYRVSNFLLWQIAYTEFYFTTTHWPDFDEKELDGAIAAYAARERRFGKTSAQMKEFLEPVKTDG